MNLIEEKAETLDLGILSTWIKTLEHIYQYCLQIRSLSEQDLMPVFDIMTDHFED